MKIRPNVTRTGQTWAIPGAIALVALLVKGWTAWAISDHPLVQPEIGLDTAAYVALARRVAAGDLALGPGLYFLSPLYAYVLGAGLWLTSSLTAVRLLQATLGAAAVAAIWLLTRRVSTPRSAWLASGLALGTGLVTFYESLLLQSSLDFALAAGALLALVTALQDTSKPAAVSTGVLLGLLVLNRPNALVVVAGLGLGALLWRPAREHVRPILALAAIGLAVALAPVLLRNVVVAQTWSVTSSHGGLNFAIGNGPDATGFYRQLPGISPDISGQSADTRRVAEAATGRTLTDADVSDYFFQQGLSWMTAHPVDAAALFLKKLALTFHSAPVALPYSYAFFSKELDTPLRWFPIEPWLFVPLGLIGLVALCRGAGGPGGRRAEVPGCRSAEVAVVAFAAFYALSVAVFFVADRYRLALYVPLLVGAGTAADHLWTQLVSRQWRSLAPTLVGLGVFAAAVNWPLALSDGRFEEGLRLAQRHAMLGQHDDAARWVERLSTFAPRPGAAHVGLGMQYQQAGDHTRAAAFLAQGLQREPGHGVIAEALAQSLRATGNTTAIVTTLSAIDPAANPDVEADRWLSLGRLAAGAQAPELADRFFSAGLRLAPSRPDALLQHGVNLLVLSRFADARPSLEQAARLAPQDVEALAHLALCLLQLGELDNARRVADAALTLAPEHSLAKAVRARTGG